jgi:4-amino-4-deoxy-L-arabinose transferase-like glycosyltransferase
MGPSRFRRLIVLGCLLVFFIGLGATPLTDRDEGEYASSVAEMVRTGDYLSPTLNGRRYFEKPILTFWLIAASYRVFGHNEFAVRLPSAVCAALLILLVYLFAVRVAGARVALWAAVCLTLCLGTLMIGRTVLTDMPLTLFTTGALFAFFIAVREPIARRAGPWYLLAAAALGLAFLTKGPVALAICLGPAAIFVLADRRLRDTLRRWPWLFGGLIVFGLIAAPWYAAMLAVYGAKFWHGFFLAQNVSRLTSSVLGMGASFLLYLPVMLVFFFPWIGLAGPGLAWALRPGGKAARREEPRRDLDFLCAWWVIVVLVVFSVAQTKLPSYIFPMFPALAILAGRTLVRLQDGIAGRFTKIGAGLIVLPVGLILVALLAALPRALPRLAAGAKLRFDASEYAFLAKDLPDLTWLWLIMAGLLVVALVLFVRGLIRPRGRWSWAALAATVAVFFAVLFGPLQGAIFAYLQVPAVKAARLVKTMARPEDRVATYALWKPTLFFYLARPEPVERIQFGDKRWKWLTGRRRLETIMTGPRRVWVITRARLGPELSATTNFHRVARLGGYLVFSNRPASRGGGRPCPEFPWNSPPASINGGGIFWSLIRAGN